MCLAIPAQIEEIQGDMATCQVGESDTRISASTMLLEEGSYAVGDWVLVHAGFAIRTLDPQAAEETLRILRELSSQAFGEEATF